MLGLPSPALYAGAGLLGLLVLSGGINACQHRTIGELRTELGEKKAQLDSAIWANASQTKAIDDLKAANDNWAATCVSPTAMLQEAAKAAEFRARIESLSGELAKVKANASPSCKALLETDFGAVCGPLTDVLRERATHR